MTDNVLREDEAGIAHLTLNRPEKLNALSVDLFKELEAHVDEIAQQTNDVGCVLLTGKGRCFSAGADLTAYADDLPRPNYQARVIDKICGIPQPVVVGIHGYCFTGALELALAADLILASESGRFADTHGKFAMLPQWGLSQRLPRRVGKTKATEMMLTGKTYTAVEALEMNLVNNVFPDSVFETQVRNFCADMLANSWHSLRGYKHLVNNTDGMSLNEGLAFEYYNGLGIGPDMEERIAGFTK